MNEMTSGAVVAHELRGTNLMSAADILAQVSIVQQVMKAVMKEGTHYGVIPGTDKPTLLKPGAEVLCAVFRIADKYEIEDLSTEDSIRYRITCRGVHQTTGIVMGEGLGECSTNEKKYKWLRVYSPKEWEATPENRRRKTYVKTKNDKEYEHLQVRTDPFDLANTVLKMAAKRAKIAMTLNVTAASDIFTQDAEDLDEHMRDLVDDERRQAGGGSGVQGPQSTGEAAARERMEKHGAPTGPAKDDQPKEDPPATDGMLRLIRAKATAAGIDELELCKACGVEALPGITVSKGNELLAKVKAIAEEKAIGDKASGSNADA